MNLSDYFYKIYIEKTILFGITIIDLEYDILPHI